MVCPLFFGALLGLGIFSSAPAHAGWLEGTDAIMGTNIHVELWDEDEVHGRAAIEAVMEEMRTVDRLMSPYRPESELTRVNDRAALQPVRVGPELFGVVQRALEFSRTTGGAFDITFASVGYLYDYRAHEHPSEAQLREALPGVNYRHVMLDERERSIRFARAGVRIDLGGIAKGWAVEQAVARLRERGIRHALVTAGGDSRVLGDRRGRPWTVGIRDPRDRGRVIAMIPLADAAISTSGDYERYFEEEGVRYHHIINPATGKSAGEVRSVTIIGPDATSTDALSTSVFVLGPEKGLALIDSLSGIECVIIDQAGKLYYSRGLERPRVSAE